ncbi:WAT1-related protein At2g39510-like isoform X2 [Juglans microcarpa x Juglans regia]|uniref:WAT1-related protein At2g39510-like isoform X2 n=1 Tax=Juglans microcarpa x Juglans regia TaxID=2249226 RepID=UPI001B7E3B53|nr:WAT1-related protein At2g39510-like isoform X2 [Juglans microcarpa x Juglans regia]
MESVAKIYIRAKPFLAVTLLQSIYAGMEIIFKFALNQGMSQHVVIVYRPVIDQSLYYTGMKYTTATFASAMCNILPAFAFLMAWICGLEKVSIRRLHSQAKILGTIVTVGGAMVMTLFSGPTLKLPWTNRNTHQESTKAANEQDHIKGGLMVIAGSACWSGFIILQAITLRSYPAELSLTVLICLMGTLENTILALVIEWGNPTAWSIHMDTKLLAALYGGIVATGIAYWLQGAIIKERGPIFVTATGPLTMVLVAIMGSFILAEMTSLGRVIGAVVIVGGLYLVVWGKSKDGHEHLITSTSDVDKAAAEAVVPTTAQHMATTNHAITLTTTTSSNQDQIVVIDHHPSEKSSL